MLTTLPVHKAGTRSQSSGRSIIWEDGEVSSQCHSLGRGGRNCQRRWGCTNGSR